MKTLYSSAFLSIILAFFAILGMQNENIVIKKGQPVPLFSNMEAPKSVEIKSSLEPITVDIFNTFGCHDCKNFGISAIPVLVEKYSADEDVDVRVHTIPNMDDESEYYAAVGLKCADEHDKYMSMHNELHADQEKLSLREVDLLGQELELPLIPFRECLKSGKYDEDISAEISYAKENNIIQSPTILIEGYRLYGNQPVENIQKVINDIIRNREEVKFEQVKKDLPVNDEDENYKGNLNFNINE